MISNYFPPHAIGGAENSAYHTCLSLLNEGLNCQVLTINNRSLEHVDEQYELDGIQVHRIEFADEKPISPLKQLFDWRIFRHIQATLRKFKPDIVHIHNVSGTTLSPYLACRLFRIPVVNTLHDLWLLCPCNLLYQQDGTFCDPRQFPQGCQRCFKRYDYWGDVPQRRRILAKVTASVKTFISPSQALIEKHVWAGYDARRFQWVPYTASQMVHTPLMHPALKEIVETAGDYRTLAFAGGGVEIKGVQVLIDAIPMLLRFIENLRIVVVGSGEPRYLDQLKQYEPAVRVLGRIPNKEVQHLFAAADLTLMLSTCHENSPMVIYENHQLGTPVVGSNFGGIPELIDEGETGYLFAVGDAVQLTEKVLLHFSRSNESHEEMGAACRAAVQNRLATHPHLSGVLQVYERAVQ
ncbi:MAG: glycosyltransferase [Chloroflexota bacterium]